MTVSYGHAHPVVGVIAPIALASYIAAFGGLFAWSQAWLGARGLASPWSAALAWAALDHLRSFALSGFPWAELGYAQHQNAALMGLASFTAVYGLSFVERARQRCVARRGAGRARARAAERRGARRVRRGGRAARPRTRRSAPRRITETLRVAVIQGNIDQGVKWNAAWIESTLAKYESLSREAARATAPS